MKKFLIVMLASAIAVGAAADVRAQVSRAGVIFLLLPPGARASGMGDAFASIADDATATYWNPAGLGRYPLSPAWFEYPSSDETKIRDITIMDNGMPDNNYKKYDTWGILGNRLARFDGEKWDYGQKYYPAPRESAEDIARRFSGIDDEDSLKVLKNKLASFNSIVDQKEIEELSERVLSKVPDDYPYIEDIRYSIQTLKDAWAELTIDKERFQKLRDIAREGLADDTLTSTEIDKITFAVNNSVRLRVPSELYVPYDFILPDTITVMASDSKDLWIGTPTGLFKYNGKRWKNYTVEQDSIVSNDITAIGFGQVKDEIWIGTRDGVSRYYRRKWNNYTTENGLPSNNILAIAAGKRNTVWVAADKGLAKLAGNEFRTAETRQLNIGEDIPRVVSKYLHLKPGPAHDAAVAAVMSQEKKIQQEVVEGDSIPQTTPPVELPYSVAVKGDINTIHIDGNDNLWVGTTEGLVSYGGESWTYHGYKEYTAQQGDNAESIAKNLLGKKAKQENIDFLAGKIRSFNNLDTQRMEPGDAIYIPSAPIALDVVSICDKGGDKVLVGTERGTFRKAGDSWKRYMHAGLEDEEPVRMIEKDGEIWFATKDKLVVHAHSKREMAFMHSNWLVQLADDIYFEYLSYVQHFEGIGTMGAAITFLSYGSQERTNEAGISEGTFASYEMAVGVSYGTSINEKLALGMSAKYIHSHLSEQGAGQEKGEGIASSFAVDGGMLWKTPVRKLTLGLTVTNLGPDISYIDAAQADPLPRNLTVSLAYELFKNPYNKFTVIGEATKQLIDLGKYESDDITDRFVEKMEEVIAHIGAEYWYGSFLALRGGFVSDKAGQQQYPTVGIGLRYSSFGFDFSYIPSTSEEYNRLGNIMRFSMTGKF